MKKQIVALWLFVLLVLVASPTTSWAQSSMTDQQVIEYVKDGTSAGKSQQQIATELASRGVTKTQAQRVKKLIEEKQESEEGKAKNPRTGSSESTSRTDISERKRIDNPSTGSKPNKNTDWYSLELNDSIEIGKEDEQIIFGHNIFSNQDLTFAPSQNMATPQDYKLGPGDEVIIDIWGSNENSIRQVISPEGSINIDNIGLIYLSGMRIIEAESYLRHELRRIYAGIDSNNGSSDIRLTLGQIRTIQVHLMGEVAIPGSYSLSSFSTIFHALYCAGGITKLGSLRDIYLMRDGKKVATLDIYDFLLKGKNIEEVRLQEGDVIMVPTHDMLVNIVGKVKRPMFYEMKKGESVQRIIEYSGNFTADAYRKKINMIRKNGREYQVYTIEDNEYAKFNLMDGDSITVGAMLDRFENRIEIKGAVYRPGIYQYGSKLNTVRQLIEQADGLMEDAFTSRAVLHRQRENLTNEVISIDIESVLAGSSPDIPLKRNDVLYIPSIHDLKDRGYISILGHVAHPGEYAYSDNTTLEDIIVQAGGLLESASMSRVDISRRIKDAYGTLSSDTIGKSFSFGVKEGFVIDGTPGFVLEPYDVIVVRKSPSYHVQTSVSARGEVEFEGQFTLTKKNERLSDLIARTGGLTKHAYVKGARLTRRINDDERTRMEAVLKASKTSEDSINIAQLDLGETYYVGIDLQKAIANPGGDADIVLRAGDVLDVPEYINTVKVSGTVMHANTVAYDPKASIRDYIDQAGGYGYRAKKSKTYIVYLNGQVRSVKRFKKNQVEPGCEIIVPTKPKSTWSIQNTLSIATTTASLATMAATIANILK